MKYFIFDMLFAALPPIYTNHHYSQELQAEQYQVPVSVEVPSQNMSNAVLVNHQ